MKGVIDLHKNVLRMGNIIETNFLPESELPTHARLSGNTPDIDDTDSHQLSKSKSSRDLLEKTSCQGDLESASKRSRCK